MYATNKVDVIWACSVSSMDLYLSHLGMSQNRGVYMGARNLSFFWLKIETFGHPYFETFPFAPTIEKYKDPCDSQDSISTVVDVADLFLIKWKDFLNLLPRRAGSISKTFQPRNKRDLRGVSVGVPGMFKIMHGNDRNETS